MKSTELECKKLLTLKEVAEYTGFKLSYLHKLTHRRQIPFYKPFGKVIFIDRDELETWLKQNRIKTMDEIESDVITSNLTGN